MASAHPPFSPRLGKGHMEDHLLLHHDHLEGLTLFLFTFHWPKMASPHLIAGKDGRCRLVPHKSKCILKNSKCTQSHCLCWTEQVISFLLSKSRFCCMYDKELNTFFMGLWALEVLITVKLLPCSLCNVSAQQMFAVTVYMIISTRVRNTFMERS